MGYPAGQCNECGGEPRPDRRTCAECADRKNEAGRALRADRKRRGLCTTCGVPAAFERTLCKYHLAYFATRVIAKQAQRRDEGLCLTLGCPRSAADDLTLCRACLDRMRAQKQSPRVRAKRITELRRRRSERLRLRLCVACPDDALRPAVFERTCCQEHLDLRADRQAQRVALQHAGPDGGKADG